MLIAVPLLAILWWAGQPVWEWRVILGVAVVATLLERAWPYLAAVATKAPVSQRQSEGIRDRSACRTKGANRFE